MKVRFYSDGDSTDGPWQNRLSRSSSVYLRQHSEQPINWYPWGEEAFERAVSLNRPVLVSVGYSACHWCHVMARESFSDLTVANLLNTQFVAIKVDRESQPEVDAFCIQVLLQLQGDAGWPANVFLSPHKVPLMGGTYYPLYYQYGLPGFADVLRNVHSLWTQGPDKFAETGQHILQNFLSQPSENTEVRFIAAQWETELDERHGGFGWGAKFPMVPRLDFMFAHLHAAKWQAALRLHLDSLDKGGIHDHVGGGFHRYAIDVDWSVPHYEKMLCDNALIARAFLRAHAILNVPHYRTIGCDTLEWLIREMRNDSGLFAASVDAEDPLGEGYYYTWTREELRSALGSRAERIIQAYDVGEYGNTNIGRSTLVRNGHPSVMASVRLDLLQERAKRPAPSIDTKCVASWNAMTGTALCMGFRQIRDQRYLDAAVSIGEQLIKASNPLVPRIVGVPSVGTLEDQAWCLELWLELYSCSASERWLKAVSKLIPHVLDGFRCHEMAFQLQHQSSNVPVPIPCSDDTSEHSPLAVMMRSLEIAVRIGGCGITQSELNSLWDKVKVDVSASSLCSISAQRKELTTVVLTDIQSDTCLWYKALSQWRSHVYVFPESSYHSPLLEGRTGSGPKAWICTGQTCRIPISTIEEWPQLDLGV